MENWKSPPFTLNLPSRSLSKKSVKQSPKDPFSEKPKELNKRSKELNNNHQLKALQTTSKAWIFSPPRTTHLHLLGIFVSFRLSLGSSQIVGDSSGSQKIKGEEKTWPGGAPNTFSSKLRRGIFRRLGTFEGRYLEPGWKHGTSHHVKKNKPSLLLGL